MRHDKKIPIILSWRHIGDVNPSNPKSHSMQTDSEREDRIYNEVIVDAYDDEEKAMGWYYYLHDKILFPFQARCIRERAISPLLKGEEVKVLGMPSMDECLKEVLVNVKWNGRQFAVPLAQLKPLEGEDTETKEAVEDWHYWVQR